MRALNTDEVKKFLTSGGADYVETRCKVLGISVATFYRRVAALTEAYEYWSTLQNTQPHPLQDSVLMLSVEHPSWGCARIAKSLNNQVSPPTIQSILNKNNLRTVTDRSNHIVNLINENTIPSPNHEQLEAIFKSNLENLVKIPTIPGRITLFSINIGRSKKNQCYALFSMHLSTMQIKFCIINNTSDLFKKRTEISFNIKKMIEEFTIEQSEAISEVAWSTSSIGKVMSKYMKPPVHIQRHFPTIPSITQVDEIDIHTINIINKLKIEIKKHKKQEQLIPLETLNMIIEQHHVATSKSSNS